MMKKLKTVLTTYTVLFLSNKINKIYTYIKQFNYQIALNNFCIMHVC